MANTFKVKKLLGTSGVFSSYVEAPNLVYNTGNQVVSGVKNFSNRPTVNGTGVLLSGEAVQLPNTIVYTTGNQTISGLKDFTTRPTVNTTPVLLSGENANGLTVLVKNDEPTTLLKGQPVYIYGANGSNILVRKASNTGEAESSKTLGLLAQNLNSNDQGLVVTEGALEGIDTDAGNAGDPIWLGPTGNLIFGLAQKPYAPNHLVYLGVIERKQSNNGKIYVKVQNGFELQELHNVNIDHKNALNDSDILRYNSASGLWFNETLNTGIFQTQINSLSGYSNSTFATITNLAATGSANLARINSLSGYINSSSSNIVFTTGNQNISGDKNFIGTINTTGLVVSGLGVPFILKSPNNQNSVYFDPIANGNAGILFANHFFSSNLSSRDDNNFTISYGGGGTRYLVFSRGSVNRAMLDFNGNFGIASGISSVPSRFYVSGDSILQGDVKVSGNVGIGTTSPAGKLHIKTPVDTHSNLIIDNTSSLYWSSLDFYSAGSAKWGIGLNRNTINSSLDFFDMANSKAIMTILPNVGNVGIGTTSPSQKLDVAGNANISGHLSAASKSFLIPHPADSSKKLQYGSLESPYHGIRLTDKGKINSDFAQIDLPNYISKLVLQEGVNIQLTNINHDKTLFVKEVNIENNYFKVGMNRSWLDKNEYEFYWSFTAERKDIPKLIVEF